uniref:Uncharacterized protein n=1 Tax=Arundo donax TaxID=35708 RepID=A0A0A9BZ11_ARUDO
MMRPLLQLLT